MGPPSHGIPEAPDVPGMLRAGAPNDYDIAFARGSA
jgi:hypothetical protein